MKIKDYPKEPGLYWAKSREAMEWWDLIIEVHGEAPYLNIVVICDRKESGAEYIPCEIGVPCYPPRTKGELYAEPLPPTQDVCFVCGTTRVGWYYKGENYCNQHAPPEMHETG